MNIMVLLSIGTFLFKPSSSAAAMIREWWDYDIKEKNLLDFMEQDALWMMLQSSPPPSSGSHPNKNVERSENSGNGYASYFHDQHDYGFLMNADTVTVLKERQFPSDYDGVSDLWYLHLANYQSTRKIVLRTL